MLLPKSEKSRPGLVSNFGGTMVLAELLVSVYARSRGGGLLLINELWPLAGSVGSVDSERDDEVSYPMWLKRDVAALLTLLDLLTRKCEILK